MSLCFWTGNPSALLNEFDKRIEQTQTKGKIETWVKHEDGKHYTHTAAQWKSKAFFRPVIEASRLVFHIVKPTNAIISTVVYGYYHGHLTETFLNHFDANFSTADSSARPVPGDICS